MNDIKTIITIVASGFAIISGITGILIPLFIYIKSKGKFEAKIEKNEENINLIREDVIELRNDIKDLSSEIRSLPWKILDIVGTIFNSKELKTSSVIVKESPIKLSEFGNKLAEKINANEIIEKYKDVLIQRVKEYNPKTAYEIQELSKQVINTCLIDDIISEEEKFLIEDVAYNEGEELETLLIIFSIKIRDIILLEANLIRNDIVNNTHREIRNGV